MSANDNEVDEAVEESGSVTNGKSVCNKNSHTQTLCQLHCQPCSFAIRISPRDIKIINSSLWIRQNVLLLCEGGF